VVAGSLVFIAFAFIAGALGLRLLRIAPLPNKDQRAARPPISGPDYVVLPESETAAYVKYYLANPGIAK
jgi:hypothetical protein